MKRTLVIVAVEAERAALGAACLASPAVRVVVAGIGRTNAAAATAEALAEARAWSEASDVEQVPPDDDAVQWFLAAMARYQLGRKRVLDTMLAATYRSAGVTSLLTLNAADFAVFGEFACLGSAAAPAP
jgi:predicted nucleic acid-binding protein